MSVESARKRFEPERDDWAALVTSDSLDALPPEALVASVKRLSDRLREITHDERLALAVVEAVGNFLKVSQGGDRTGVNFNQWVRAKGQLRDTFAKFQDET